MSLVKNIKQMNENIIFFVEKAAMNIADGGFNKMNISDLSDRITLSTQEIVNINKLTSDIMHDNDHKGNAINKYGLVKPTVPSGLCYPDKEINELVIEKMWNIICSRELYVFYTQEQLQFLANSACRHDYNELMKLLNFSTIDETTNMVNLTLYDVILLVDDNASMNFYDDTNNMHFFDIVKENIKIIYHLYNIMDSDGINIRFLNSTETGDGVNTIDELNDILKCVYSTGITSIENGLEKKIFNDILLHSLHTNEISRPIMIIILTDCNDNIDQKIVNVISKYKDICSKTKYGRGAITVSLMQSNKYDPSAMLNKWFYNKSKLSVI
jgi:hypothetical protein